MPHSFHSVKLARDKCKGCTTCITTCPTEAIRVRNGKAVIIEERCIDCGACIRICPSHAKEAISDALEDIKKYDYKVAVPAPTLYGQFNMKISIDKILTGLLALGFDEVFEAADAAEVVAAKTRQCLAEKNGDLPLISSSCPAIVRLIQLKYPGLLDQIIRVESPMETAARIVKEELHPDKKSIGVFFISPCAAKVTAVRNPMGCKHSSVDGVIPIKDIYLPLMNAISEVETMEHLGKASFRGISWAVSEGEGDNVGCHDIVAVDGIDQVAKVFEEIENRRFRNVDFIEAMACPGGCVGGPLTVENPYIAKARIRKKAQEATDKEANENQNKAIASPGEFIPRETHVNMEWQEEVKPKQIMKLDEDFRKAVIKMEEMEAIEKSLPGLDCGSCGAPTCKALSEDIVRGYAVKNDCIFILKEEIQTLASNLAELGARRPLSMDKEKK
ncbi:MAG: 4Fe-4S binding protein [Spirochaetales bacterium]|nr:4Fe-4S binding protein [Spirochaetales bacterium]